ncbi:PQQ-binding-like beta-propeller repeat protein [Nocardiopsis sp. CC223A]|uniref:outer membrane protein assembly factor BamB family protein n=1 Tax=Nocardiopsis sp. CC223A TaxID=3044051 RepID=UPI002795D1C7|nr:PQQ-binding-like beta-propeller repeat protein [Nocardiopsis sp. CC223A]
MVVLDSGFVGLRGDTGEELWSYTLPDTDQIHTDVSSDGTRAAVRYTNDEGEPVAVLLDTSTGSIVSEDAHWDGESHLLDAELQIHRHYDEDGFSVEVADLADGRTMWRQEEPVACSEGPSRQVRGSYHADAVVLLAYCADDVSEEAMYSAGQQATHVLVALDPGSGRELWRHEISVDDTQGYFPESRLTQYGDTLVVKLPGVSEQLLLDTATGDLLEELSGHVLDVTEEAYLARMGTIENPVFELRGFDGQVLHTLPTDPGDVVAVLDEGLLRVRMERGPDGDTIGAEVTPWQGGDGTVVETGLVVESADSEEPGRLLRMPGAVLLYPSVGPSAGVDAIEHIVALQ